MWNFFNQKKTKVGAESPVLPLQDPQYQDQVLCSPAQEIFLLDTYTEEDK